MTIQQLTNSCKDTCVSLLAAQQPIQCKYNSTACDKSARLQFLLGDMLGHLDSSSERGPVLPAYRSKWRTPEAPPGRGRDNRSPSKTTDPTLQGGARVGGWDTVGWGGTGRAPARHHVCPNVLCITQSHWQLFVISQIDYKYPVNFDRPTHGHTRCQSELAHHVDYSLNLYVVHVFITCTISL